VLARYAERTPYPSPVRTQARESVRSVAFVLTGAVLFGTAGTAAVLAPAAASPASLGALRLMIGAVILIALIPLIGGSLRRLSTLLRRRAVWIMAVAVAAFQPLFFGAVDRSGVALSTLLTVGAAPVVSGLLGRSVLRQPLTRAWMIATAVAVVGLFLRSWGELEMGDALGVAMALGAGVAIASYVVAAKGELDRGAHSVELPATAYLLGSILLIPILISQPLDWVASVAGLAVVIYLGAVTMAVANVSVIVGLRGMSSGPASTLLLADPLTATLLGVLLLDESLSWIGGVGLILVLIGLVLQARAVTRNARVDPEPAPVM
jgi:DME family drug/metabolite transporter